MKRKLPGIWTEYRGVILFLVLMAVFRSSAADWNYVPTSSMRPSIVEGDRVLINKLAYDVNIPFLNHSILHLGNPERGDVVVFESAAAKKRLIKRVIGIPGDAITVINNRVVLNGAPMEYRAAGIDEGDLVLEEIPPLSTVSGRKRFVRTGEKGIWQPDGKLTRAPSRMHFGRTFKVPENHYFVMGDHRDNSADSRYYGYVPRDEIIGRSRRVVFSHDRENYYLPRRDRWMKPL